MAAVFSIRVSADPLCRALAGDIARRYVELAAGTAVSAAELGAAVSALTDAVARGDAAIDLVFNRDQTGIEVDVACEGRHEKCRVRVTSS